MKMAINSENIKKEIGNKVELRKY